MTLTERPVDPTRPDPASTAPGGPGWGLDPAEAAARLERTGPNRLTEPPTRPGWLRFLDQFRSVLVAILAGAAVLAAVVGDLKDAVVVAVVLLINAVLGYVQEGKAERALTALKQMLVAQARVRRGGQVLQVPAEELVPGDVVLLEAGDRIPADGRFLTVVRTAVDESSLTGESVPVDKTADALAEDLPLAERRDRGFMNTTVVRGRAELLVTATGMDTEMGKVAALMHEAEPGPTPLQVELDRLGTRLALVAGAAVSLVFLLQLAQGVGLAEAALGSVALAVAAIPEGLPAVVTVTLAVGVHQMALRRAIVKRLASVETLGSTTVICSDKTGTLTLNQMTARAVVTADARYEVGGEGYRTDGSVTCRDGSDPLPPTVAWSAALCADAVVHDGELVGDPTEGALVVLAAKAGVDPDDARSRRPRLGEVPFDATAKYMATFHAAGDDVLVVVKGAPDVVLARSRSEAVGDQPVDLDEAARSRWEAANAELAGGGLRVLALAVRRVPGSEALGPDGQVSDPERWIDELTVQALVGIVDPPRVEAADAIAVCRRAGIAVKMITGDHAVTAAQIARQLGIGGAVVSGAELEAMDDEELARRIDDIGVCARVSPEHKVRVVRALQARGHVVAMTGDGVNDAAALRTADIGVAMGITGTEVTKEAADMVLTDDDFATIVGAVERGRAIFDNIVKFVRFQLTTNLGAIGTITGASVLGLPTPLSAIQVLFVNIIADGPPAMTLGVDPASPGTMARPPRSAAEPILGRRRLARMLGAAVVMAAGTLTLFAVARSTWDEEVALTMAFTTFVLFQLVNVFNARTEVESVVGAGLVANRKLLAVAGTVAVIQVLAVATPVGRSIFDTVPLTAGQWALCAVVALSVLVTEEARKAVERARARDHRSGADRVGTPEPEGVR